MATTYKVGYKNHCTSQEQHTTDGRYYLDSDVGKKMTGTSKDFVYVKNTGTNSVDMLVALDGSTYVILLSDGEAFASEISTSAAVKIKTASGVTQAEYYVTT